VLLLDAGDVFEGTPFFNYFHGVPDYRSMSAMRYDLGTLGNHDLALGPQGWTRARPDADFDLISANLFGAAESAWAKQGSLVPREARSGARWVGGKKVPDQAALHYLAPPYVIRTTRSGIRVAIFGLLTKDFSRIAPVRANEGVAVGDPIKVARLLVPELRRQADLVVALSHMGVDADSVLVSRVSGIDVVIGGHSHTALHDPIRVFNGLNENGWNGSAIAQAGSRGQYLGRTVIYFDGHHPIRFSGSLLPILPASGQDPAVAALLRPYADSIDAKMSGPVFKNPSRVPSSGTRDGETALGDFVADVLRAATGADVGLINSGGIRAPLPAGEVTVGDVWTTLPFDNQIVVVTMPGWQLRQLLAFSAARLGKGGFLQVSGVKFVIARNTATYVRVGDEIIDSNRSYRVATVDYLYYGGDGYTLFEKAGAPDNTGILLRDAAVQFLRDNPDYRFEKDGRMIWEGSMTGFR
jgi:2',3'-cyclic-nucleotide 2'-phosphodiesterase (5'-nucleotidase family)